MGAKIPPSSAQWLGYAGLLPALAACLARLFGPAEWGLPALFAHLVYAAVILSFVGGAWWGLASARAEPADLTAPLALSVLPSLAGWGLVLAGSPAAAAGFGILFLLVLAADRRFAVWGLAPSWWLPLRVPLSVGMAILAFVSAIAGWYR